MRYNGLYYKGEDIGMRLRGSESIDLDALDWEIALAQGQEKAVVISKSSAERVGENMYTLWVDAETSRGMRSGKWDIQLRLTGERSHIAVVANAITIVDSAF